MTPNITSNSVPLETGVEDASKPKPGQGSDGQPASTYAGIWKYPTNRDNKFRIAEDWLACKAKDDDVGTLWRVFDNLYDLTPFIASHPGGSQWIELSRGIDITEAFVASHAINTKYVERMLEKYYVKPATSPRITPFTLKPDGFYMTLKKRAEPIFKKVGTGPSIMMRFCQDITALAFIVFALLGSIYNSMTLSILSGTALALQTIGSHNFLHLKENWRKFYMDLSLMSSFEFRITHTFSHHLFVNTLMDYELDVYPTYQFLPNRPVPWIQQKFAAFYGQFVYASAFWLDIIKRFIHVAKGEKSLRPENFVPFIELLALIAVAGEPLTGLYVWVVVHTTSSYVMQFIASAGSHHHATCFVDGDEPLPDPDFGIGQLDATKDRAEDIFTNLYFNLVTFGYHPLHHLFPTVCHSKLHHVQQVFEETMQEYKLHYPNIPVLEMYVSLYESLARTKPKTREDMKVKKSE